MKTNLVISTKRPAPFLGRVKENGIVTLYSFGPLFLDINIYFSVPMALKRLCRFTIDGRK